MTTEKIVRAMAVTLAAHETDLKDDGAVIRRLMHNGFTSGEILAHMNEAIGEARATLARAADFFSAEAAATEVQP